MDSPFIELQHKSYWRYSSYGVRIIAIILRNFIKERMDIPMDQVQFEAAEELRVSLSFSSSEWILRNLLQISMLDFMSALSLMKRWVFSGYISALST